ncbi:hypothetical protein jaqu_34260 [Jannaschia aquimarina]|uniref:ABC-2 type transporter n=2 Tax=Jannaschia aquimarina TaxID=935700 RepID=A0A0D1EBI0_9RHOB|nr:hypothetical protein jaqu_34260 [Jannaschia aquimarina]SNS64053.1 ABC-type polysaccharide/polyol phosphate export permease [Jannaschia aquimarina]
MFVTQPQRQPRRQSLAMGAFRLAELIFHATARQARQSHSSAMMALGMQLLQSLIFVAAFYVMFTILGLRGAALRGDFILFIVSGIFLFITHVKAVSAVAGAEGPTSAMMNHAPMNTVVAVISSALASLYISTLSILLILTAVHLIGSMTTPLSLLGYPISMNPLDILDPAPAIGMYLLAWFSGCAIGLPLHALKPWLPNFVSIVTAIYSRVNMIASGKMFVVNMLPADRRPLFDWNPLFHIIDQCRGFTFVNYNPAHTDWTYAFWLSVVFVIVGIMGEFFTGRHASASWSARR